jgi:hypothetical protein
MNNINYLSNIYFIFYVPGSMGSLLSVLIRSQMEENFNFNGFNDNTAHYYSNDALYNTHNYQDYLIYKKTNLTLEKHMIKNIRNNKSLFQRCDINWCNEFKNKSYKSVICYIDDPELKIRNLYDKLKNSVLDSNYNLKMNFTIDKTHKKYEKIIFIKTITWWINQERKYLKLFRNINLLPVIEKKDFTQLENICKITNRNLLNAIIDNYNSKQTKNIDQFPEFSGFIKKYLKNNSI